MFFLFCCAVIVLLPRPVVLALIPFLMYRGCVVLCSVFLSCSPGQADCPMHVMMYMTIDVGFVDSYCILFVSMSQLVQIKLAHRGDPQSGLWLLLAHAMSLRTGRS